MNWFRVVQHPCLFGLIVSVGPVLAGAGPAAGETLTVGPGKRFDRPSAALLAARDGDTIEIDAAGIRAEGEGLTVRACTFGGCNDAILGGRGEVVIEHSEFAHCGRVGEPATHNLYIGGDATRLPYRHNDSHFVPEGHLLKSRARETWIVACRLTDEDGTGSAVADFPHGGPPLPAAAPASLTAASPAPPRDRWPAAGARRSHAAGI